MMVKLKQKNDSLKDLATRSNLQYPTIGRFLLDNRSSIIWTALGMAAVQVTCGAAVHSIINNSSNVPEPFLFGWIIISRQDVVTAVMLILYLTLAYMGQDFLFSALSRTSKEVRGAIDYKTTISDKTTGTTDAPTPMVMPKDLTQNP